MRLLVKPEMMCLVQATAGMCPSSTKQAEAVDVLVSPVAVHMVVCGALVLMFRSGADVVN